MEDSARRDDTPDSEINDGTSVPIKQILDLAKHPAVNEIVQRAAKSSDSVVSTSLVLFAMADLGDPQRASLWTGDFLASTFAITRFEEVRRSYLSRNTASKAPTKKAVAVTGRLATQSLLGVFSSAARIALSTTRQPLVHARHLLAALLVGRAAGDVPIGATQRLEELGLEPAALRDKFLGFVVGYGDDDDAWARCLETPVGAVHRLASYAADSVGGEDLLNIKQQVVGLATLIAARQVIPPFSIGLFGEWGSGKTFFMRQLQSTIAMFAKDARTSGRMQRDVAFYKRIVQIEFNAWHYVQGDLWASLVGHIFDNLKVADQDDDTTTERLQKKLLNDLKFRVATKEEASQQEVTAREAVRLAAQDLRDAETERDTKRREITALKAENIRAQFPLTAVQQQLAPVLAALNLGAVGAAATDLGVALTHAEATVREGGAVLGPLLHAEDRGLRWVRLIAVLTLPPLTALGASWVLNWQGTPRVATFMTGAAATLGFLSRWLNRQSAWAQDQLKRIREIQNAYDRDLKDALAANEARIGQASNRLEQLNADLDAARRRREEAEKALAEAQRQLTAASSVRLLASFIQDRASSTDYRKHLGLLALVRADFENLSGLIEDENWKLAPTVAREKSRKGLTKFQTIEEELVDIDSRINRIVLYIDDLDRCPPAKVVDVLQAVHLLLAFPLFVVVVGVDARWIKRSLQTQYRQLLHGPNPSSTDDQDDEAELIGRATVNDYLEKIFQVPFWINTMNGPASAAMVTGLLGESVVKAPSQTPATATSPHGNADGAASGGTSGEPASQTSAKTADEAAGTKDATGSDAIPSPEPNIESLQISQDELASMQTLAPLLGRSPRSLKRFVNVYRLVKASLSPMEYRAFIRADGGAFRAVQWLLAIDSGFPNAAPAVFRALGQGRSLEADASNVPEWLAKALYGDEAHGPPQPEADDRQGLVQWLKGETVGQFVYDRDMLSFWASRVARYSFGGNAAMRQELTHGAGPST